jgi:hypothetical protein
MARLKRVRDKDHRLAISGDHIGEVFLVRGGPRRAYIWAGIEHEGYITITGETVLRKLATEILKELDAK